MTLPNPTVQVFRRVETLGAFVPDPLYLEIVRDLHVEEWTPVVWIGRFFLLDNDFGEHWFDHWDEREARADEARALGHEPHELLFLRPSWFQDGRDGPVHTDEVRGRFWTDVLTSLRLSLDTIADEARVSNAVSEARYPDDFLPDLEARVERWRARLAEA